MPTKISLAAGGTAGHIEPALAVARWFRTFHPEIEIEFIGTRTGLEMELVPAAGFALVTLAKVPLPRKFSGALLRLPFSFFKVVREAYGLLTSTDLVIGFGGYVSAPCYFVARLRGIPILIHEQNAKPGIANRLGAWLTPNVQIAFSQARRTGSRWHNSKLVGMPLRESISNAARLTIVEQNQIRHSLCARINFDPSLPIVVLFGGSQGSMHLNLAMSDALETLLNSGIQIIHGLGKGNELPPAQSGYLPAPYLSDMAEIYASSDLVIARSGAVTCSEVAAFPRFAIFVPLPIGNGEQQANAAELVSDGLAEIVLNQNFTSEWLIANIQRLVEQGAHVRATPRATPPVDSADLIGSFAIKLLGDARRDS
ncbi:MAG: UDP-N-acetylglucosamine--N-acetylmuramyl-(pentapeptide) pyrophosphoryl-undecaprenol N-acetylglucosamine transferase [Actinomycetes bacterium]